MLQLKDLGGFPVGGESNWVGWGDLEGVRMTARREAIDGMARGNRAQATKGLYHIGTYCQVITVSGLSAVSWVDFWHEVDSKPAHAKPAYAAPKFILALYVCPTRLAFEE